MFKILSRAAAACVLAFGVTTASAATFNQVGPGIAGGAPIQVDVDLGPFAGHLALFNLTISPVDPIVLGAYVDDLSDGGVNAPLIQVVANSTTGPILLADNSAGFGPTVFFPFQNVPVSIIGTNRQLGPGIPENLSKFSLFFAAFPGTPDGPYQVAYSLALDLRDDQNQQSFVQSGGSFNVTVGPIAPVPLPAGGLLLISGLGAIALVRRKKSVA